MDGDLRIENREMCSTVQMIPLWRIQLLGRLCLRRGDEEITRFRTQKMAGLLAYLALYTDRVHTRERLQELFWPKSDLDAARNSLGVALNSLRKQLEPLGTASGAVLFTDRSHVRLNPGAIEADVHEFVASANRGLSAPADSMPESALVSAAEIYTGPLLPGHYEDWVVGERERLADLCQNVLRRLIKELARAGSYERALVYARQAVLLDPLREEFHRSVMRLCVAIGRPAAALDQFAELERQLQSALHAVPSTATRELAERIAAELGAGAANHRRDRCSETAAQDAASSPSPFSAAASVSTPERDVSTPTESNLPSQFSRFFGRESELQRIQNLLSDPHIRLVTLTGLGGCGKTRLALEAAQRLLPQFDGNIWWVSLCELDTTVRFMEATRDALKLPRSATDPLAQLTAALKGRSTLLVLDNAEHLAESLGGPVRNLLQATPGLKLLATSRQPLEVAGERELVLQPLPVPELKDEGGRERADEVQISRTRMKDEEMPVRSSFILHPSSLLSVPSVQLFVDRAQTRRADFQITHKNVAALASLCARLEGLPLAIELAASWSRLLSPAQMLRQLDQRFAFLVSRNLDLPPRQRTLRAAIEGSYQMLSPEQQALFTALAVFRGGFTLEAAEAVCTGLPGSSSGSVLVLLAQLQARSLIMADEADEDERQAIRYRLLESLREFAQEQWTPELRLWLHRWHALYFMRMVEEAAGRLRGVAQGECLRRLEADHSNLQAAMTWCAADAESVNIGLQLGGGLWLFWHLHSHYRLGHDLLTSMLSHPGAHADAMLCLRALHGAGVLAWSLPDFERSCALHTESLSLSRQIGYSRGVAASLGNLAIIASMECDFDTARTLQAESLEIYRAEGLRAEMAPALNGLGQVAIIRNDLETAQRCLDEAVEIYRELDHQSGLSIALSNQCRLATLQRQFHEARAFLNEKLRIDHDLDFTSGIVSALTHSAALAAAEGQTVRAVRLWSATATFRSRLGQTLPKRDQMLIDQDIATARSALSMEAFKAAWDQGAAMTREEACILALQEPETSDTLLASYNRLSA